MNHKTRFIQSIAATLGLLALVWFAFSGPPPARAGDDSASDLFENGWTLDRLDLEGTDRPGVRRLHADGRFRLPADQVWRAISGQGNEDNWPGIRESVVEHVQGDTTIRRYVLDVPIYPDRTYRLRMVKDEERMHLKFDRVPGYGNVNEICGIWEVTALSPFETHVSYRLDTDPGVKLVPGFIVKWATKKAVPRSFAHIYGAAAGSTEQTMKLGRPNPGAY